MDILNWFLLRCLNVLGTTFSVDIQTDLPRNTPILIVSNHQAMWDIPPIIWYLRKYHPKFISKKELGKGVPSISFNLRHGGSILIDRDDREQAVSEMLKFTDYLNEHNRTGVIFPEGTRSRNGVPKPFKHTGLKTLFERMPTAYVIPVTVNNSWKLQRWGMFPMPIGTRIKMIAHPALKISDFETEELITTVEEIVTSKIEY